MKDISSLLPYLQTPQMVGMVANRQIQQCFPDARLPITGA
ncbi:hypothetical protein VIC_003823 [Vibrio coralliilyticus ATCC BAA-450]|nr:hypothetical protein VIC_003823 [Vibrio coralliilyticus ATCC BAA-450]